MRSLAYIDPGTGAIILQAVLAGIMTVGIFFRQTLPSTLRRLFGRERRDPVVTHDDDPDAGH